MVEKTIRSLVNGITSTGPLALIVIFVLLSIGQSFAQDMPSKPVSPLFRITKAAGLRLSMPTDVAVDDKGRFAIVDGGNHRALVFDSDGDLLHTLGSGKSSGLKLKAPIGVGMSGDGKIYLADSGNNRIVIYGSDGKRLRTFKTLYKGKQVRPVDVAVSKNGKRLYVTTNTNHSVLTFTSNGRFLKRHGREGVGNGEFRYPASVTTSNNGRTYIVDVLNTRIQMLQTGIGLNLRFGEWGVQPGQLIRPKGIALDRHSRIYVSDSYSDVIHVYNDAHQFTHVLGSNNEPHRFISAAGIAIDGQNRLFVAEVFKNRVSVYSLGK